jgi:beta-N-acetylhexosaminidase
VMHTYCSTRPGNLIFLYMKSMMTSLKCGIALLGASFLFACAPARTTTPPRQAVPVVPQPPPRAGGDLILDGGAWVEHTLARLTLRQKVGQLVVPRISGAYMPTESAEYERLKEWIVKYGIGGVIITQGPPLEMAAKLNTLQRMADVPLLVTADMEHGPGQILMAGIIMPYGIDNGGATRFPPLMALGAAGDEQLAYELGRITAQEGRAVGVHVTFSPVVDVNNNPNNPIINTRSYGEDPDLVARMASAHIRGIQDNGMIATAKHFPGHGDTGTDSHVNLPVITVTKARADTIELPPYQTAIRNNVGAIMSAHIAFPALTGDSVPGTLNQKILTGLLRDELKYQGIIFTDAMDMGAIINTYGRTNASVMALKAGADVLLQPFPQDVPAIIDAIVAAVEKGELSEARINEALRRMLNAKMRVGLQRERTVDLNRIQEKLGPASHVAKAQEAADRSITVVRDQQKLLPIKGRVLSIVYADDYDPFTGRTFQNALRAAVPTLRTLFMDANATVDEIRSMTVLADSADVVMFSPYIRVTAAKADLAIPGGIAAAVNAIAARKPTIVTSFGNPYVLTQFPNISTYVLAWGQWDVSQRAAAKAVTGQIPITGKLPIAIPPFHRIGEGVASAVR